MKQGYAGCNGVDSLGNSGGLFLCWSSQLTVSVLVACTNFIICDVLDNFNNNSLMCFVHGAPNISDRGYVWENLSCMLGLFSGPICLIGDFIQPTRILLSKEWGLFLNCRY